MTDANYAPHNHPPACCCQGEWTDCPVCPEHGELQECPSCHTHAGHPHTDYCIANRAIDNGIAAGHDGPDLLAHVAHAIDRERARRTPPPVPVHRCTDPACPIHGAHAHAGNDILMRHPWCTCQWLEQWRTWPGQPHRPSCPVLTHPTPPPTPPTT